MSGDPSREEMEAMLPTHGSGGSGRRWSAFFGACGLMALSSAVVLGRRGGRQSCTTETTLSCFRDPYQQKCGQDGQPKCISSADLVRDATSLERKLTKDDLENPHKSICAQLPDRRGSRRRRREAFCKQAYDVLDEWKGLAVYSWAHDYADSWGTNGWGVTYLQLCNLQYRYTDALPSHAAIQAATSCKACQACGLDCYKVLGPVYQILANEYTLAVKPLLRNSVQTVAWIKYTQRIATQYSVNKVYDMVLDSMVKQPSPPQPQVTFAQTQADIFRQAFVSFTKSVSVSFTYLIPGLTGIKADILAAAIRQVENVIMPIMEANGEEGNPWRPNGMSDLYRAKGNLDYGKDAMTKYYIDTYDNFVDAVRNQTAYVVRSSWARRQVAEGLVDFNGTQSTEQDKNMSDVGYCVDPQSSDLNRGTDAFAIADSIVQYVSYQTLFPITYQICAESRHVCELGMDVMSDYVSCFRNKLMGKGCEYRPTRLCLDPGYHPAPCHSDRKMCGCDKKGNERSTCVGDHLVLDNTRLLWDTDWRPKGASLQAASNSSVLPPAASSGRKLSTVGNGPQLKAKRGGQCAYVGDDLFGACRAFKDYTQTRTTELGDVKFTFKGWFCGYEDAFDKGPTGEAPVMASTALLDTLDDLLRIFSGYNATTKEGFANMTELLAPQIQGNDTRLAMTNQLGWQIPIRRLPDGPYQRSKYAAALTWNGLSEDCDLICGKGSGGDCPDVRTQFSQGCCGSQHCLPAAAVTALKGQDCSPEYEKPCNDTKLTCAVRAEGISGTWHACCEHVNDRGECTDLGRPDTLPVGNCMQNACLDSSDGRHQMCMQGDGNLVKYENRECRWASKTSGDNAKLCMQSDGNLVVHTDSGAPWATGVSPALIAVMQNDGNFVLYQNEPTIAPLGTNPDDENNGPWGAVWSTFESHASC